ncbi:GATA transcription factor 29-like isoform X1 [Macadamia integrifolia]|uniref:GATA transcription factor 29-like isoform X1 n=1 Tax=Macadamia integrifolia TaxID=60698 RepID=UPI001C500A50|nr:GATA transcription factor 29-like isoform X1 [Macadamia integrifolia]XP_042515733.1 GATA transcription factor 29-like isoform X1 [Macadamia integrifolia]
MAFTEATLNLMRNMMYLMQMELLTKDRTNEPKEQDFISRLGKSDDGNGGNMIDRSLSLGLKLDNNPTPTNPSTANFYGPSPIRRQVRNNHHGDQVTKAMAFQHRVSPSSDHHVTPNNNSKNTTGFIDFLGETPVMSFVPPRRCMIPILAMKYAREDLSLAPPQPIGENPFQRGMMANLNPSNGYGNGNKVCTICKRGDTPLWRAGPHGPRTLCNACGIHFQKLQKRVQWSSEAFPKPKNVIRKP